MSIVPQEVISPWKPNMIYRPKRNKNTPRTLCEQFIEDQVVSFYRTYFPIGPPNADYSPIMDRAANFANTLDLFDNDANFRNDFVLMHQNGVSATSTTASIFRDHELASLLRVRANVPNSRKDHASVVRSRKLDDYAQNPDQVDQLVWGLVHQEYAHPGVQRDLDDPFFIAVLIIRHFKYNGGLVLPPLQAARVKQAAHEVLVASEKALNHSTDTLFMYYPNWRDSQGLMRPPGLGGPVRVPTVVRSLASNFPADRSVNDPVKPGGQHSFGAIGDGRSCHSLMRHECGGKVQGTPLPVTLASVGRGWSALAQNTASGGQLAAVFRFRERKKVLGGTSAQSDQWSRCR